MTGRGLRLIADIGGTNARFALVRRPGVPEAVQRLPLAEYPRFEDALRAYLAAQAVPAASLAGMAIAAAGPVRSGKVRMTNADWSLDAAALSAGFGGIPVSLMNDVAAVAQALPFLTADDRLAVRDRLEPVDAGAGEGARDGGEPLPLLAVNAGTGLGAAVAVPVDAGWTVLPTEAGHMRLGAADHEELALFAGLETVEDLIAGPGWQRFRRERLGKAADGGASPSAARIFSTVLGRFAGDMVLATGAWGGVYFCGGVMNSWDDLIDRQALLAAFNRHGAMSGLLETVPLFRLTLDDPALRGLSLSAAAQPITSPPST